MICCYCKKSRARVVLGKEFAHRRCIKQAEKEARLIADEGELRRRLPF